MTTPLVYEAEPAQRRFVGTVRAAGGVSWSGTVTVPEDGTAAILELTRHGPALGGDASVVLTVPVAELPALATLLAGLARDATPAS